MTKAAVFDIDGTLVDSVDLHACAWQEAFAMFGYEVTFEQARSQIGKGGDQLIPVFLSEAQQQDHGVALEEWRGERFRTMYLPMVRPFSAVPELLRRVRDAGLKVAVASSAKRAELEVYLELAGITGLVDESTSSGDADKSKPAPDIFEVALQKLRIAAADAVAIGDTPYDAQAAGKAGMQTIGCAAASQKRVSAPVDASRSIRVPARCWPASTLRHSRAARKLDSRFRAFHHRWCRRCNWVGRQRTIKCNASGTSTPSSTIPTTGIATLKGSIAYNATKAIAGTSHPGRSGCRRAYESTRRSPLTTFHSKANFFITNSVLVSATPALASRCAVAVSHRSNPTPGSKAGDDSDIRNKRDGAPVFDLVDARRAFSPGQRELLSPALMQPSSRLRIRFPRRARTQP
jgi:HAD superfamily hydrolase (TIGR01549 family)